MSGNSIISDKTNVPIAWLFSLVALSAIVIASTVSVSLYVSKIENKTISNEEQVKSISADVGQLMKDIYLQQREIDRRLSRIEGKLGVK